MVKNESEHKHATTYQRRENPFSRIDDVVNGLDASFGLASWSNASSPAHL
jgi:hypothetical protein